MHIVEFRMKAFSDYFFFRIFVDDLTTLLGQWEFIFRYVQIYDYYNEIEKTAI